MSTGHSLGHIGTLWGFPNPVSPCKEELFPYGAPVSLYGERDFIYVETVSLYIKRSRDMGKRFCYI